MKKILLLTLIIGLISCNTQPVTYVETPQPQTYVPTNQDYQVIVDPVYGTRNVVYSMNGLQYIIAYNTFMNWYNYGGLGYVNSVYATNRTYFGAYNSSNYRNWKSSTFRDSYRGPSRTSTSNYNRVSNTRSNSFNKPSTRQSTNSSSFSRPTTSSNTTSSFNRPTTSRPTQSSSSTSSFSRPSTRSSSSSSSSFSRKRN